ncbi:hypothetical protein RRG08_007862 [Elysia crispata]|uniref:Uncharacterized protein n=1 Tax=Elysia crispata TaxID=231223 RepID=A0AAE0XWE8_9GAST|nr:hypothetical protein RRG08_007862 [Elysia crispata]
MIVALRENPNVLQASGTFINDQRKSATAHVTIQAADDGTMGSTEIVERDFVKKNVTSSRPQYHLSFSQSPILGQNTYLLNNR